ncbi:MAG: LytTR family transcriptional regulator DNA-binding domain-containing protein [Oribacterium sp.]|nr:LytTR family transcriptional regulator DNA-binding domain-containing protein [Oribacterium sp.]
MCLVSFPFVGGERSLDPESIIYVQTEGHRNVFFVIEGQEEMQFRIYQRLDEIERVLLPYGFIRCHRSCLVNMRYVTEVSNYLMTISTGEVFTIPRSRYQMVKKLFREYTK